MGWRSRFDPSKFRIDPKGGWRAGLSRAQQVGLRGEVIVPIVAFLLLAAALGLSALSSRTPSEAEQSPAASASASASVVAELPTAIGSLEAYPAPSDTAAPIEDPTAPEDDATIVPPIDETTVAEASPGAVPENGTGPGDTGVYPAPDNPIGEGQPGDNGSLPPPPDLAPPGDGSDDTQPIPTEEPFEPIPTDEPFEPIPTDEPFVPDPGQSYPPPIEEPTTEPGDGQAPPNEPGGEDATIVPAPTTEGETPDETATVEPGVPTGTPTATPLPPTPTARPAEALAGDTRWTTANSPVTIARDTVVPAGSTLTVDPGVEVRVGPGVRLTIVGALRAAGARFVGSNGRWEGIVGAPGSTIALDGVEIHQAGSGGISISSTEGTLAIGNSRITDSGGGIYVAGSAVELRGNTISGNAINGPAVHIRLPADRQTVVAGNVFAGNGTPPGSQQLLIAAGDAAGPIAVEGNLFAAGGGGIGATVNTGIPISGAIRCNTFNGGTIGLQLQTSRPDAAGFEWVVDNNAFAGQASFGATGSVGYNLSNNWWNDPSGPAVADRNPQGRGVAVGVNQQFQPWLNERPSCAPNQ